jgi:hypothetical protein
MRDAALERQASGGWQELDDRRGLARNVLLHPNFAAADFASPAAERRRATTGQQQSDEEFSETRSLSPSSVQDRLPAASFGARPASARRLYLYRSLTTLSSVSRSDGGREARGSRLQSHGIFQFC